MKIYNKLLGWHQRYGLWALLSSASVTGNTVNIRGGTIGSYAAGGMAAGNAAGKGAIGRGKGTAFYCCRPGSQSAEPANVQATLLKGAYLCMRYRGTVWERQIALGRLLTHIRDGDYIINGNGVQICIIDENSTNRKDEQIFELQIPYSVRHSH